MSQKRFGLQKVTDLIGGISRPFMQKHSLLDERVFTFWQDIIGKQLSSHTLPLRLIGQNDSAKHGYRKLEILVTPGAALEVSYAKTQLIEKVNQFYGYSFISDVAIKQGKIPELTRKPKKRRTKPISQDKVEWVENQVGNVQNAELRDALTKWGKHVVGDTSGDKI